ncbi:hypothetical protein [Paraburkholderia xenovorans]|uniref:hypothetical protein n=1 Tax=Paraburkholderia xenovorans TaxID=36873 RepID=UPI0038B71D8C
MGERLKAKGVTLASRFAEDRVALCGILSVTMPASMHHDLDLGNSPGIALT